MAGTGRKRKPTPEELRQLVRGLANTLDLLEYRLGIQFSFWEIRGAIKAVERINLKGEQNRGLIEETCSEYLHKLGKAEDYSDIDLSKPDYKGMDDPL